jgi:hypothetical protein
VAPFLYFKKIWSNNLASLPHYTFGRETACWAIRRRNMNETCFLV